MSTVRNLPWNAHVLIQVAEGAAAEETYIIVYNLHLSGKEALSLEDLTLMPQDNAILSNVPSKVVYPEGKSTGDLSGELPGFDPAWGGFPDPSTGSEVGMAVLDSREMRHVAVIMLDAKISIPATSAASFTSRTSDR